MEEIGNAVFGARRDARFGDLDGDGIVDMLIAQNIPRVQADAFDQISSLTAVTLKGKALWQSGRTDPRNGLLTKDTPFQIHDIDGDGHDEVVTVRNFQLQILEGRTGKVRRSTWMPQMAAGDAHRPYEMENGDSIAFLNLSGNKDRHEILAKDHKRGQVSPRFAGIAVRIGQLLEESGDRDAFRFQRQHPCTR